MNEYTYKKRLSQLVTLVNNHKYKTELLNIMQQQLDDDSVILDTE